MGQNFFAMDAYSLFSGVGSILAGQAAGMSAGAQAEFEAAQLDAIRVFASADRTRGKTGMARQLRETWQQNAAAMAVTGLATGSFDAIFAGDEAALRENEDLVEREGRVEDSRMRGQATLARLEGRMNAKAAIYGGITQAASVFHDGHQAFRKAKTDETGWDWFVGSLKG